MRHIRITVEDSEFEELKKKKSERGWREAILEEFGINDE